MKPRRLWIGRCALLLILCSAIAVPVIWDRLHILYATPDTESTFLKNYNPQSVIEPFKSNLPSSDPRTNGSGAGRAFVTQTAEFQSLDLRAQLLQNGAQIFNDEWGISQRVPFRVQARQELRLGKDFAVNNQYSCSPSNTSARRHRGSCYSH